MRSYFISMVCLSYLLISCLNDDLNPPLALREEIIFIMPDSSYQFNPNVPVDWKFVGKEEGSFNSTGNFTAGTNQASIIVQAISKKDTTQKKKIKIIISTHATLL